MPNHSPPGTTPDPNDPQTAARSEAAWTALRPQLDALSAEALLPHRVSLVTVVSEALRINADLARPEIRARFALLPREIFDSSHLQTFTLAPLALLWAQSQLRTADTQTTVAKLPIDLVDRGTERKQRLLKLLSYHCSDNSVVMREIEDITSGNGYEDLALDLMRLAKLHREQRAEIQDDKRLFRADDDAGARADAEAIVSQLRVDRNAAAVRWADQVARAWTLMYTTYELHIRAAGLFVFRSEPDAGARFPSLVGAVRATAVRREGVDAPVDDTRGEGQTPVPPVRS